MNSRRVPSGLPITRKRPGKDSLIGKCQKEKESPLKYILVLSRSFKLPWIDLRFRMTDS